MSDRAARVAAAIMAGGQGTRLGGEDKSALVVQGRTIAERQLEVLEGRFSRVLCVMGSADRWEGRGVTLVSDRAPAGRGPLAGIDAALAALLPEEEAVVCVACDMPFLTGVVLELLRDEAPDAEAVVPRIAGMPEPLLARYSRRCAPAIAAALAAGRLKTGAALDALAVHWLSEERLRRADPGLASLANVNTPDDLERAQRRA